MKITLPCFTIIRWTCLLILASNLSAQTPDQLPNPNELNWSNFNGMLERNEVILDEELTALAQEAYPPDPWLIYRDLNNDRVYLQPSLVSKVIMFESETLFRDALQNIKVYDSGREHTFHDYIEDSTLVFRSDSFNLGIIAHRLRLELAQLDMSLQSIKLIQAELAKKPSTYQYLEEDRALYYAISNYVGDMIYESRGGWSYMLDQDGKTILPADVQLPSEVYPLSWFRIYTRIFMYKRYYQLEELVLLMTTD